MERHEAIQWSEERPLELECPHNKHDAPEAFLKPPHVDLIRISHFSGPFREPLCSALRDAQVVSAVQQFELHPDNCLATCRLVPRKWHPTRAAEEKESEQREAIVFSSCF